MARTGVNNKKNNTKLNRAEGMMLIIVILHINYTAINNSFFTNPNKKNTAIGEKSIPILCIGNISLIGFKMGSVTWYRSWMNWFEGLWEIQLRKTRAIINICSRLKTLLIMFKRR